MHKDETDQPFFNEVQDNKQYSEISKNIIVPGRRGKFKYVGFVTLLCWHTAAWQLTMFDMPESVRRHGHILWCWCIQHPDTYSVCVHVHRLTNDTMLHDIIIHTKRKTFAPPKCWKNIQVAARFADISPLKKKKRVKTFGWWVKVTLCCLWL